MNVIIEPYGALCELREFTINGIQARYQDFGDKFDHDQDNAPDYGCGDMRFDPKPAEPAILEKYHITPDEYDDICEALKEALNFGGCGWCV